VLIDDYAGRLILFVSYRKDCGDFLSRLRTVVLQRVISITNVGRFKNCAAYGDVTFRRYTMIFAENGRGKITLCAILRSLFTNTPALIIGRKTLEVSCSYNQAN